MNCKEMVDFKRMKITKQKRSALAAFILLALFVSHIGATGQTAKDSDMTGAARVSESQKIEAYPRRPSKEALKWADAELKKMSLEEKIGQLISIGLNARFFNQESEEFLNLRKQIEKNHVGGIILFRGPVYESAHIVNRMQALARRPLLISADLEAGAGMRFDDTINFPWNMAVAATGDPSYARRQGEITAREARALGVQQIFAPVADVNNNAANPVINVRSYGEDPAEVARFVSAFIEGAQGAGVISTAKHFPGHGDTNVDSHRGLPIINVDRTRLDKIELVPFRAAIASGVGSIMSAHIGLPKIDPTEVKPLPRGTTIRAVYVEEGEEIVYENGYLPATLSPVVLNRILRRDLGFEGLIVTDAFDMSGLTLYFTHEDKAVRALQAGADVILKPANPEAVIRGLVEGVKSGGVTEARIEESARRILAAKYDLGLVKNRYTSLEHIDTKVSARDAAALAEEVATRAITLVRDENEMLKKFAALPANARIFNLGVTNGEDRVHIANSFVSTLSRAGRKVDSMVLDFRSTEEEIASALERAGKADFIIFTMYGRVRSGAANSVGVPEKSLQVLKDLIARKANILGVSFGNPYLLQDFPELGSYIVAYGDMPSLQRAAARALLGQRDITGRLPITLPGLHPRGAGIQVKASAPATK